MKIRSDSLYVKLQRAEILDDFFIWVYAERPGYKEISEWLDNAAMPASDGAIHTLLRVHSLYWKVEQAERRAAATDASLPDNVDAMIRKQLKQKEFDLSFANLSTKEALNLLKYDQDKQSAKFKAALEKEKMTLKRDSEARASESLAFDMQKYRDSMKTAIERAMDALASQTKDNPDALQHYKNFRAAILQSVKDVETE